MKNENCLKLIRDGYKNLICNGLICINDIEHTDHMISDTIRYNFLMLKLREELNELFNSDCKDKAEYADCFEVIGAIFKLCKIEENYLDKDFCLADYEWDIYTIDVIKSHILSNCDMIKHLRNSEDVHKYCWHITNLLQFMLIRMSINIMDVLTIKYKKFEQLGGFDEGILFVYKKDNLKVI